VKFFFSWKLFEEAGSSGQEVWGWSAGWPAGWVRRNDMLCTSFFFLFSVLFPWERKQSPALEDLPLVVCVHSCAGAPSCIHIHVSYVLLRKRKQVEAERRRCLLTVRVSVYGAYV